MTSENTTAHGWAETLRLLVRPFVAVVAGAAEPRPKGRPWPSWLRWTRRIGVGQLPFGLVAQVADLIIAVSILFGTYSLLITEVDKRGWDGSYAPLLVASILLALPMALRERHPMTAWRVLVIGMAWSGSQQWLGADVPFPPGGSIGGILVLYTVAVRCSREITIGVGIVSIAGAFVVDANTGAGAAVLILLPLLVGSVVRLRQTARRELAEQERRHQDAAAVLTERQRIARELHDVVAHHMSMIAIQAEAAPYKAAGVPEQTKEDLAEIRATALEALTEMRRMLGVLRSEDGSETAPQPSLARLDELVAGARGTGLAVRTEVAGDPGALPPGVGLTAYRILQEALSNAMRHAPGSQVTVRVALEDNALVLSVVNGPAADGQPRAPGPPGDGHGLVGMRERVGMLGGELTAGPTPDGGFAVATTLPVTDAKDER